MSKISCSKIACISFPLKCLIAHLEDDFRRDVLSRLRVECLELSNLDSSRCFCKVTFDGNDWVIDVFYDYYSEDLENEEKTL